MSGMLETLTLGAPPTRPTRILGVFAHPDDETFCAGGTFARYAAAGAEIMVVSATRGQAGQIRDANVGTRCTIGAVRENELRLACKRLGVAEVRCWDHVDGALQEADFDGLVAQVVGVIREFRPDTVITFGPDGGYGHPDHIVISTATTEACRRAGDARLYSDQLAAGLTTYRPFRLYHSNFPTHDVLLMKRLATWLTRRSEHFTGSLEFSYSLLLMAEEAATMGFIKDDSEVRWFAPGCYVVEQGEAATELYLILSGHADVCEEREDGTTTHLRHLGPGEFFGEVGLVENIVRSANVIAADALTCLVFSPAPRTLFAGRGKGAHLVGTEAETEPGDAVAPSIPHPATCRCTSPDLATAHLDVTAFVAPKVEALSAYRSQFPFVPEMYPSDLLKELFGWEYFIQVHPPRSVETEL